jgi:putative hydrolase of HD superfamily
MAMMLGEYFQDTPDVNRAVKMVIVHDLIEIYAGDTFAYDTAGNETKQMREKNAADKLFSQLPEDQNEMFRALWEEFDAVQTADARFANCMDRIQPFLHNTLTEGATWKEAHACRADVEKRMETVSKNMPRLREWITSNLDNAVMKGWLTA